MMFKFDIIIQDVRPDINLMSIIQEENKRDEQHVDNAQCTQRTAIVLHL